MNQVLYREYNSRYMNIVVVLSFCGVMGVLSIMMMVWRGFPPPSMLVLATWIALCGLSCILAVIILFALAIHSPSIPDEKKAFYREVYYSPPAMFACFDDRIIARRLMGCVVAEWVIPYIRIANVEIGFEGLRRAVKLTAVSGSGKFHVWLYSRNPGDVTNRIATKVRHGVVVQDPLSDAGD